LTAGTVYVIKVRLVTNVDSAGTVTPQVTIQIHSSLNADPSIINQRNSYSAASVTNYYTPFNEFKAENPKITF
jgi:hypothetical protein